MTAPLAMTAQVTVGTPPANYQPDSRRVIQRSLITTDGLHIPSGGQPVLRSKVWPGAGLIFIDTITHGYYYYSGGIFRNLADADCNGFIDIPQVTYQGTPFHFSLSASRYNIDCIRYTRGAGTLIVNPGDTLDRYDVFYADTTGYHIKEGEPNETPQVPTLSSGQLYITQVFIPAYDSLGTGINEIIIYNENTESTISNSGITSAVGNSTAGPYIGTYHTRITTINNGDYWEYTIPSGYWDVTDAQLFSWFLKNRAQMPQLANLRASLWNGTTQVSQFEPTIGFDKNNTTTYQGGSISMSAFGTLTNTHVTKVRFRYTSNNATNFTGYDFDYIHFINGIGQPGSSGGVSSVDLGITGTAISISGPSTGAVNKTFTWLGNSSQYTDGGGILRTYNALTTIGAFNSLTSDARGANSTGNTIAFQPVTGSNPGMATPAMKGTWDSTSARVVQNLGTEDTLAVYVNALTTGFKSLKDSTGIGIIDRGDHLSFYSTGGGGVTASEGLLLSGSDVRLGGPIGSPTTFSVERSLNVNRKILHLTNGIASEAGGAYWQFTQRPYSPYQFISSDTVTTNDALPDIGRPLSGIFARRQIYFNSGIYKTQQSYGHYLGQTYNWADTVVMRNDGDDFQQALIAEQRYKPRNSGYQVIRMANGTGNDARKLHANPTFVSNTYYDPVDNASTDTLRSRGVTAGVVSYLVASAANAKIRADEHVYFQAANLVNSNSHFNRTTVLSRQTNEAQTDTAYFVWDTLRTSRSYLQNLVLGFGDSTQSGAQFKVYGSSLHNGWSGYQNNIAANYTTRSFTDKNYVDSSVAAAAGTYTDEKAQDAVGAMIDGSLNYVDATPLLQRAALTGDVTASAGSNSTTIANNAVTNAKAAQMAAHTFKGNNTGSTANAIDLTATQLTAELNVFGASLKGLVPAAAASPSSSKYLTETGVFTVPPDGGVLTVDPITSANANGAVITGTAIALSPVSSTSPGVLTTGTQSITGNKTFNDIVTVGDELRAQNGFRLRDPTGSGFYVYLNTNILSANRSHVFADEASDTIATRTWARANLGGGGGGTPALTQYRLAVGDASNLLSSGAAITGSRALVSDANGVPTHATTTTTEVNYLSGVTSAIQTQLNALPKNLKTDVTDVGNVTTGEDDLITYSVPAAQLAATGDYIEFEMSFVFAANSNNKQVKIKYGAVTMYATGAQPQNDGSMVISGRVIRTGAATQRITVKSITNGTMFTDYADYTTATETLSGAVTLKATGEGTATNDIIQKTLVVKYFPGN
jgi:hypothetical protein